MKKCALFEDRSRRKKRARNLRRRAGRSQNDAPSGADEDAGNTQSDGLPCRIEVRVSGVEAFIYNRGPAYDWVVESCTSHGSSTSAVRKEAQFTSRSEKVGQQDIHRRRQEKGSAGSSTSTSTESKKSSPDNNLAQNKTSTDGPPHKPPPPPSILRLLPVYVHCNKAAAVLGNEGTPSILSAKIDSADGTFDASEPGPLDVFKILMQFSINRPFIQMKPNVDYKRPQLAEAEMLEPSTIYDSQQNSHNIEKNTAQRTVDGHSKSQKRKRFFPGLSRKAMESLDSVARLSRLSVSDIHLPRVQANTPGQGRWLGLTRYLDSDQRKDDEEWKDVEYAKASTLADLESVDFKFFWDIAGPVPRSAALEKSDSPAAGSSWDVNNGDPPEYGMELLVHGGTVTYGPWSDRHRLFLQQLFFPSPFADAEPLESLSPGETRLCTVFKLFLSIEADTILRIPFKEPSKDYKWKGRSEKTKDRSGKEDVHDRKRGWRRNTSRAPRSTHARPYAWFDIKVKPNTTVNYTQDMFPTLTGYQNELRLDVSGIDMFSSLNHALLWRSGNVTLTGNLPYPLKWNGLREWTFGFKICDLDFYLLRDHTFLLMDMIEDWTTGPLPEFLTFVPYRYILRPIFERFKLFLNVNDANIIDKSDDLDDNDFAVLYGRDLVSELIIPIDRFRPATNEITFDVISHDLGFNLSMPPKNTLHAFLADKDVAQLPKVTLKGSYVMCSEVRAGLVEQLNMEIVGTGLRIAFYGFFARHLAKIKENYFGEDIHFRTLQEYQELVRKDFNTNEPQAPIRGNDLDVILDIIAEDAHIMVPSGLYSCEEFIELYLDTANVDLRVNNYYLELMVDSSPLQFLCCSRDFKASSSSFILSEPQITIDSVNVYGHRLFGLPPSEPAYVSNWDIDAGDILGECSSTFLAKTAQAVQALIVTITDEENGLPIPQSAPLYDTTYVRWNSGIIRLWLKVAEEAFLLSSKDISGSFNDFASQHSSQTLRLSAPEIALACVQLPSNRINLESLHSKNTFAYLKTAVSVQMIQRAADFAIVRRGQQDHIAKHDAHTGRSSFMVSTQPQDCSKLISLCLPSLVAPLLEPEKEVARSSTSVEDPIHDHNLAKVNSDQLLLSLVSQYDETAPERLVPYAQKSIFLQPTLPIDDSAVDLSDVPELEIADPKPKPPKEEDSQDNMFNIGTEDGLMHTCVSIKVTPGVTALCKPQAVFAASKILSALSPREPEAVFDQYQSETVNGILAILRKQRGKRYVLDLGISVPSIHARLINSATDLSQSVEDEYNIIIRGSTSAIRIKSMPERKHADDLKAVHLTVASISISVKEQTASLQPNAVAFRASISDIFIWLADSDRTLVNASYDRLEVLLASKELKALTSLVYRALLLGSRMAKPFVEISSINARRRRFLIYKLVEHSRGVNDPSFLTRPAYMIRSAQDHLRNSDSWKVVARLRWVLCCLDNQTRVELWGHYVDNRMDLPLNDEEIVLNTLDQLQSWDAVHVKDSLAMQLLFGRRAENRKVHQPGSVPLSLSIHGAKTRTAVDHGSVQNEASVQAISISLSMVPPPPQPAGELFHEFKESHLTMVHVSASGANVDLNWELCDFVDDIITLSKNSELVDFAKSHSGNEQSDRTSSSDATVTRASVNKELHVVLQFDSAVATITTVNLTQTFSSQDLKLSVVEETKNSSTIGHSLSVLTSVRAADMSTASDSSPFLTASLSDSSLTVSFRDKHSQSGPLRDVVIAGHAPNLVLDSNEEISFYLETADRVIKQEAKHIYRIVEKHSPGPKKNQNVGKVKEYVSRRVLLHVVLILDSYKMHVALVQDLHYIAEGRVLRLSVQPGKRMTTEHKIDFDLKAQRHTFTRGEIHRPVATSSLMLPEINGTIRVQIMENTTALSVAVSMEQIRLEGVALYGVYSMLSTAGIVEAISSLQDDVRTLQENTAEILPNLLNADPAKDEMPKEPSIVIFDAVACLVGLEVTAQTHGKNRIDISSAVSFTLGSTHFRAANRSPSGKKPLPFPELLLKLGKMDVVLDRASGEKQERSASVTFAISLNGTVTVSEGNRYRRDFTVIASGPAIEVDEFTSPTLVTVLAHFQDRLKSIDLSKERKYLRKLRRFGEKSAHYIQNDKKLDASTQPEETIFVTNVMFKLEGASALFVNHKMSAVASSRDAQNLCFSLKQIEFITREEKEARLRIDEVKLQLQAPGASWKSRFVNSALLPEVLFKVNQEKVEGNRKLFFHAAGKALDIQAHPDIVKPASELERSMTRSAQNTRTALSNLRAQPASGGAKMPKMPSEISELSLLVIDANFAGAIIRLLERDPHEPKSGNFASSTSSRSPGLGRYSSLSPDSVAKDAALRAPGISFRIQYTDLEDHTPCLNVEIKVDDSNNVMTPAVVPLILRMAHNVKTIVQSDEQIRTKRNDSQNQDEKQRTPSEAQVSGNEDSIIQRNPQALLGRVQLNVGMRISKQQFALVCQPIAKVEMRMQLEDTYITINSVESKENGNFFALSTTFSGMQASLKHVYSRDATIKFDIESIVISIMNSRHISGSTGISAMLKINPMMAHVNAKQLQDILLFREIWLPPEIRDSSLRNASQSAEEQQEYFVARYRQIAASTAFPWNATVSIADLGLDLDLGQAIGKLSSHVSNLWASSKKSTSAQQTLNVGMDSISADASGRMSGFVELNQVKVRTSIAWPSEQSKLDQTPLVQGSVGFKELRLKAAFDYQIFAIAHVTRFEFIMYNVRDKRQRTGDRLVAILDGDKVHAYCVASTAALAVSLAQAFERLIQERKISYEQSLQDIDAFLRHKTPISRPQNTIQSSQTAQEKSKKTSEEGRQPISLDTDVVVTLGSMDVGSFPRTVMDNQILRLETSDVQARFAVAVEGKKLHTGLGLTLGQVRAALATVPHAAVPKALGDIKIDEVVANATSARGGVILRVPRIVASMQTWQVQEVRAIDYIFRSIFEGKIDVGWNYSRISFIRGMWSTHARTLATRLGKPLAESALKISGPQPLPEHQEERAGEPSMTRTQSQEKITVTANVDLPQSGYTYHALEPAIIDTPQLRDMGEATPPLEWIGLNRDKLPNVTHQVVVVTLLEVVKEVEDAYGRILGSA